MWEGGKDEQWESCIIALRNPITNMGLAPSSFTLSYFIKCCGFNHFRKGSTIKVWFSKYTESSNSFLWDTCQDFAIEIMTTLWRVSNKIAHLLLWLL